MNAPTKLPPNSHQVPTHRNVHMALCAAQSEMGTVVKGAVNPAFKSRYANLADVMTVVIPALTAHGIAVYHTMIREDGQTMMRTVLAHGETDTTIECDVPLIVSKNDMQGMKSATTYAKRIGVESLTGIAPEDDDGNAAAKAAPRGEVVEPARRANINADQFIALRDELDRTAADETKLAAWLGAKSLEELNVDQWGRAMDALKKKPTAAKEEANA